MPFGTSNEYKEGARESNYVYDVIIKEGVERAAKQIGLKMTLVREVDRLVPGSITNSVIKYLAYSDVVVVDITGKNPNVFFSLGIRYTLSRRNTVLLCQEDETIPFDIRSYRIVRYSLFDPTKAVAALAKHISLAYAGDICDSPVYDTLPELEIALHPPDVPKRVSCFISYSSKDSEFASKLHVDLRAVGIDCWFAPEDIKGGDKVYDQITEAIQRQDKLLLILSEHSINSNWVAQEIRKINERERKEGKKMLFPIRLTSFETIRDWELFDSDEGLDLASMVREYYIPDFSEWTNADSYKEAFDRLLRDLRA